MPSAVSRIPIERMAVAVNDLQQANVTSIVRGLEPVFDLITDGHDSGLAKPEFGLIFYQNPEVLGYRDAVQNKKIAAVVVPVDDYLSI